MPYGLQAMLKEGHQHMKGMDEAVYRNIDACKQLSQITKTSMGPNGEDWTAEAVLVLPWGVVAYRQYSVLGQLVTSTALLLCLSCHVW